MRTATSFVRRVAVAGLAVGALSLALVACGSDSGNTTEATTGNTSTESTTGPAPEVGITGQWARASAEGATNGAVYFTILSAADETMTGVSVDATVAARAEMHQTMMMGTDTTAMGSGTTMMGGGGGMSMSPVDTIPLKAGEDFVFEPGGYHVMLFDLAKPLKVGDTISVTLSFANAGDIQIDVPVLEEAP